MSSSANQNGKLLQRIRTDYRRNRFTLEAGATLDLATGTTPSGAPRQDAALRPDNAPICPLIESSSRFSFVTLRGGGLFVVDNRSTPMRIVAEYDKEAIHGNGCGGLETGGDVRELGRRDRHEHERVRRLLVPAVEVLQAAEPAPPNTPAREARAQPGRARAHRHARRDTGPVAAATCGSPTGWATGSS